MSLKNNQGTSSEIIKQARIALEFIKDSSDLIKNNKNISINIGPSRRKLSEIIKLHKNIDFCYELKISKEKLKNIISLERLE